MLISMKNILEKKMHAAGINGKKSLFGRAVATYTIQGALFDVYCAKRFHSFRKTRPDSWCQCC